MSNFLLQHYSSDSSEDEDYIPEHDPEWKKEETLKENPKSKKYEEKMKEKLSQIWLEMNKTPSKTEAEEKKVDVLKLAREIIRRQKDDMNDLKTVIFAGSEYLVDKTGTLKLKTKALQDQKNSNTTAKDEQGVLNGSAIENEGNVSLFTNSDIVNEVCNESSEGLKNNSNAGNQKNKGDISREDAKEKQDYLNKILAKINNSKSKVINAVKKSKMDWKQFTSKEQIEDQLERNRKNGLLQKQNFLLQVNENVKSANSEIARKKVHI